MALNKQCKYRISPMLSRLFCLVMSLQLVTACSLLQPVVPNTELASIQNQRAASAELGLHNLGEIDALVKLNNRWLAKHITDTLKKHSPSSGQYVIRKVKVLFSKQYIYIECIVDVLDKDKNIISASLSGDVLLDFSAAQLDWLPRFNHLEISSKDFTFADVMYAEADADLTQSVLNDLQSGIEEGLILQGNHQIPLNLFPLGEVQVGAALPGFGFSPARHTETLKGSFVVAGSTLLIDSSTTMAALDLVFIPNLSTCPAEVTVSRAEFTARIESREPVGTVEYLNIEPDARYFYSGISGAKRPLTIIHYWFADGTPMAVEELAVGPSEHWRTWSGIGAATIDASRLDVLVVEKDSGCIVLSKSLQLYEPEAAITHVSQAEARYTFATLKDEFKKRTAAFSIPEDKPGLVLIEIQRPFVNDVLEASLAEVSIEAEFTRSDLSELQFSAILQPFDTQDIICELHDCQSAPACLADISHCKRLRDTRECTSCLFRNPLNNRCAKEAVDPLCVASRDRQNARFDAERAACIAGAETAKLECDQLNAQALRSCQIEAAFEDSACESVKAAMKTPKPGSPLAHVSAQTRSDGKLSVNFSNFRLEGDLDRLKLDITLKSDLYLSGELHFSPASIYRPLADCIVDWSAPFRSRFATTPAFNNLLSTFEPSPSALTANWSGFGLTVATNPSPLESVFVGNPQLLANCRIGLTVDKVEQSFAGDQAEFFRGQVELEIQPLPTKIHLAPASVVAGQSIYSADANLTERHLRYAIED